MQILYSKLAKHFDAIAAASLVDTKKEVAFLQGFFNEHKIHSVLDIACGTGRHSVALAEAGYSVIGIDYSSELLNVARYKSKLANLRFVQQDVAAMNLDQTFDAAICMWSTFGELPYKEMLQGLSSVLKPTGLLIIDNMYLSTIPTREEHKIYTNKIDGVTVHTEINDSYKGRTRTRGIVNIIDDQTFRDCNTMDVFTETELIDLLDQYDFQHLATYYDYIPYKKNKVNRIQLIFTMSG